jgi:hypothetical protein
MATPDTTAEPELGEPLAAVARGERGTAAAPPGESPPPDSEERIPPMQQLLDNPFALLFLGITVPTVFYILWGVMEILTVPISPLAK